MNKHDLKERTKQFAINIIHICDQLPKGTAFSVFSRQLIRSSSSMGANYRAACRAKSASDFINKLKIVEEEADETIYFLELLKEITNNSEDEINSLLEEANELLSIFVASIKTAKSKQ
jgi:four helix bundle protein